MPDLNFPGPFDKSDPLTASLYDLPKMLNQSEGGPWTFATVNLVETVQDNGDGTYTHTYTGSPQPLSEYASLSYQDISSLLQKTLKENAHTDPDFVFMCQATYIRLHCRRRWLHRSHPSHLAQSRQMARLRRIWGDILDS